MSIFFSKPNVGLHKGALKPCPKNKANCVCSYETGNDYAINPYRFKDGLHKSYQTLLKTLSRFDEATIVQQEPHYIRAEFRSRLFGFIDDVEFHFIDKDKVIHVRSASRIGYSDFGVNRRRVEKIRSIYKKSK